MGLMTVDTKKIHLLWSSGTPGTAPSSDTVQLDLTGYNYILIEHYDNSEKSPLLTATFQLARVGCTSILNKVGRSGGNYNLRVDIYTDRLEFKPGSNKYYYVCPNKIYGVNL